MTFERCCKFVRLDNKVRQVSGYLFEACFSTGEHHPMFAHKAICKKGKCIWTVTDVKTGLAVNYGTTRKDAVKRFQGVYCSKLERMRNYNAYEKLQREFSELLDDYERGIA